MDQRVEFEEYEDPVTHQRYKIKKITQYIKEEVQENEVAPNWESIPSDEFISVDQLPAVMVSIACHTFILIYAFWVTFLSGSLLSFHLYNILKKGFDLLSPCFSNKKVIKNMLLL
jgi:hypothetical protein